MKILILNGPNLNLLGVREQTLYGNNSLNELEADLLAIAESLKIKLLFFQSNHESLLIERIQLAKTQQIEFIIINLAAFTHTSIAIRDALLAVNIPLIEVHLSNIYAREEFRHKSFIADIAVGIIVGLGFNGYKYALQYAYQYIKKHKD